MSSKIIKSAIFLDLDGTLLDDKHTISDFSKQVLKDVVASGFDCFIVTGKTFIKALPYYKQLALDTPLVTSNGALISKPDDLHFSPITHTIDFAMLDEIIKLDKLQPITKLVLIETSHALYYQGTLAGKLYNMLNDVSLPLYDLNLFDQSIPIIQISIELVANCVEADAKAIKDELSDYYDSLLNVLYWSDGPWYALNLTNIKANKGHAVQYLIDTYHYQKTLAYGNGWSDRPMLEVVTTGVAMINGLIALKEVSSNITTHTNNEDGVARDLIKRLAIKGKSKR